MPSTNAETSSSMTEFGSDGRPHLRRSIKINVHRPVYTESDFKTVHQYTAADSRSVLATVKDFLRRSCCPFQRCFGGCLLSLFPFIGMFKEYSLRHDLVNDIIAGLTVGIMHIPQGMAYGMLANLPPVYGLYTSFFPVLIYFIFGTSRHISIGTFAVISLMVGSSVEKSNCESLFPDKQPPNNSDSLTTMATLTASTIDISDSGGGGGGPILSDQMKCKLGVAVAVTFMVGVYQIFLGIIRFGFVTIYLSEPFTRAFIMASACHVFSSQMKHVFGLALDQYSGALKLVYMYIEIFSEIAQTNVAALITSVICIVIIYSVQRWLNPRFKKKFRLPIPTELLVIIFGTLISYLANFESLFDMAVVGDIPTGIPPPAFPPLDRLGSTAVDAISIAIVSFAVNISMAQLFAKKHSYATDANQELIAYGATNAGASMFNCYVSAASLSRSVVQEAAGGKTQITGLISCCLLLIVLLWIGPLFEDLPNCCLAAIIIVNLKGVLMQITDIRKLYRAGQYFDLVIWIVTATAVVLTDVDIGLFIGLGFALLTIVFRTQRPHTGSLGRIPKTDIYQDIKTYPLAAEIPGIKIFSFSSSLYYANASYFVNRLYDRTDCNPEEIKRRRIRRDKQLEKEAKKRMKEIKKVKAAESPTKKKQLQLTADDENEMFTVISTF